VSQVGNVGIRVVRIAARCDDQKSRARSIPSYVCGRSLSSDTGKRFRGEQAAASNQGMKSTYGDLTFETANAPWSPNVGYESDDNASR
jgi:hypothetical protein